MYAALDLGQKTVRAVLKRQDGKVVKELTIKKQADNVLKFLNGTNANVVMESGYNYQYLYDLLKSEGYNVKVAHPLMVKAIAYAKVKTDKVDARILADLLRTDMIPECYIPNEDIRNLRDLARRRHYFVNTRTMFKNKVHVELSKRCIDYSGTGSNNNNSDLFTRKGREYLYSLKISGVKDCLDTIDFLNKKIQEMDNEIKIVANNDRYARHLTTIPGISYYAALLISSEIADINRFPDYEHLSSYAKLVPGTHQSGETRYSKTDKKGSQMLNWIMVQCIHTHVRYCSNSSVTKHYNKIKSRKGSKIAIIAAARKMMRIIYVMLKEDRSFRPDG
jgi:transposase